MASNTPGADAVRRIDSAKAFAVSPAYLAGEDRSAGAHVSRPLELDFDWSARRLGITNVILDSPCRRARIGYLPTRDDYTHLWIVNVAKGPLHPTLWRMTFGHGVPSELVAALTRRLASILHDGSSAWLAGRFCLAGLGVLPTGMARARLSRRVGAGFHGSGKWRVLVGTGCCRWSAGVRQGLQACEGVCDQVGPGPVAGEAEVPAAAGGDQLGGGGEQPQPQALGLPPASGPGQGEHRHPGQ
ncbi:DUF317 domain-containing protein [Streptomyces kaniharaensis]|uniref:DUF317 domain-containing protein n=1 Tax=Streptomyces kaniharaensis TaxID=212423 RepID=A0A6N7KYU7_9ACTN|nr:DUF317 domain-containing protein [Streptomyces kaniharaensis]